MGGRFPFGWRQRWIKVRRNRIRIRCNLQQSLWLHRLWPSQRLNLLLKLPLALPEKILCGGRLMQIPPNGASG